MNELKNWKEVTKGLYRYVIAAGACYEIHVKYRNEKTNILSANAALYIVGEWYSNDTTIFERELLHTGPLCSCITAAVEDNEKNMIIN